MQTLFTGKELVELERVDSTNNFAMKMVQEQRAGEGTVVWAKEQLSGKGQRGSSWHSKPGENLTFSIIYFPSFLAAEKQFMLSKAVSLALADLVETVSGKQSFIKWPNDIYAEEKKLAGILIENTLRDKNISSAVIGIGLNVNQTEFPANLPDPSSLKLITGKDHDLKLLLGELCCFAEARYLQLKAGRTDSIDEDYTEKLYRLNTWSRFSSQGKVFNGKITGTTAMGKLRIEKESGGTAEFDFKEITFL